MKNLLERLFQFDLPVLKEMPAHVRDLHIDPAALALHLLGAYKPSPNVVTGHIKAAKL